MKKMNNTERTIWLLGGCLGIVGLWLLLSSFSHPAETYYPSLIFDDLIEKDIRTNKNWCMIFGIPVCRKLETVDAWICFVHYKRENVVKDVCEDNCIVKYSCYMFKNQERCYELLEVCESHL